MLTIPNKNDACRRRRNFCASALLVNCKRRKVFFHLSLLPSLSQVQNFSYRASLRSHHHTILQCYAVPNTNNIIYTRVTCLHNTIANSRANAGQYRGTIQVKLYLTLSITCLSSDTMFQTKRRQCSALANKPATACA